MPAMKRLEPDSSKRQLFNRVTALLITSWVLVVAVVVETTDVAVIGEELPVEVFIRDLLK
jgi:hypothetical protein